VQTAAVAGVFLVVATALLAWDYSRRLAKDPLDSDEFKALKADLAARPQSEELTTEIRDLDRVLRAQYFDQRRFAARGGWILLGGAVVFLVALRTAATLRRRLPQPEAHAVPVDTETRTGRDARWAVAGIAGVLALAGIGLVVGVGTVVTSDDATSAASAAAAAGPGGEEIASIPPASGQAEGEKTPGAPAASASGPAAPKDEIGKSWPRFRGPSGLGISAYTNVPTSWDGPAGKNVLWKTPVPLEGNSSPVVWRDRIFLSGATDRVRQVYCFDTAGGKLLWQKDMPATPAGAAKPPEINSDTGFAANTPVTDGNRVYVTFAIGDVAAFDFAGKLAWVRSLGIPKNPYGHATSLAMARNLLLVQLDQAIAKEGKSRLLALDAATGKSVWETPRPVPSSWCTPIVIQWKGQEQIIAGGDPWTIAYQPADGKEIWRAKCLGQDVAASPVFADGVVYVANANAKASAIRVDGRGDVTGSHTLWTAEDGLPDTSSPLATPQYVLLLTSSGTLTSYDAKSGKKLWEKDFDSTFKASPSLVGKNVYLLGDEGKAWIVEPGASDCKIIAEANVGEPCAASPAFQDGRIYVRGKQHLFCFGNK
jgi:outer membrane protein assembly factor BamB